MWVYKTSKKWKVIINTGSAYYFYKKYVLIYYFHNSQLWILRISDNQGLCMYPHRLEYFDVNNSDRQKHVLDSICMGLKIYECDCIRVNVLEQKYFT